MPREKERNIAMICRKDMAVPQDNTWLIVSLMTVISAPSLLLQTPSNTSPFAVPNLVTAPSNLSTLKDTVTARNSGRI